MTKISEIVPTATELLLADWLEIEKAASGDSEKLPASILMNFIKSKAIVVPVGSIQGDAFELKASDNIADVVDPGTGVILESNAKSYEVYVYNSGANDLNVYPKVGGLIDDLAPNAPFIIEPGNGFTFKIYAANFVRSF